MRLIIFKQHRFMLCGMETIPPLALRHRILLVR